MKNVYFIFCVFAIIICAVVFWAWPVGEDSQDISKRLDSDVVMLDLVGVKFDIPLGYMYGQAMEKRGWWPKIKSTRQKVDSVSISIMLPDMNPYRLKDDERWRGVGHGDRIEVSLSGLNDRREWYSTMVNRYFEGKEPEVVRRCSEIYGLICFEKSWMNRYFPVNNDLHLTISCDTSGVGQVVEHPSCNVRANYREGMVLDYYYGRNHLENWREIHRGLIDLIDVLQNKD